MNILFITQVWPKYDESNMYSDLITEFSERGHNVCVIALNEKRNKQSTCISNEHGCKIIRVRCGNIQKTNKYEKVISSIFAGPLIEIALKKFSPYKQYDLIIWALSTTLITDSILRIKQRCGSRLYLLLKEYWPQDLVDLGAIRDGGLIYKYFKYIESKMLYSSDFIGTCSKAGIKYVNDRYIGLKKRLEVCPHCEKPKHIEATMRNYIRKKYDLPIDKCIFLFGGNFGVSQGVDDMITCISSTLNSDDVFFLLIGSGTEFNKVQDRFADIDNSKIKVMNTVPQKEFFDIAVSCDVGMIFLYKNYNVPNVPGKFVTYLNAELPILAAVDRTTDIGVIIEDNYCGIQMLNGDTTKFSKAIEVFVNKEERSKMSRNAKKLMLMKYTPSKCYEVINSHFVN